MTVTLKVQSVRRVAAWPVPGALYAAQVHTIDGVEWLIAQGGTATLPWGDPLTLWRRLPGEDVFTPLNIAGRPHNGTNVIVQTDSPLIFPWQNYEGFIAKHPEVQVGSTAMGTWYPRGDGEYDLWFVPAFGNPSNVGGAYEQEFCLYNALSDDLTTWIRGNYNHNRIAGINVALKRAALRMVNAVEPPPAGKTSYPFAHGIGGCAVVIDHTNDVTYLMLKCFYERPVGSNVGHQKNVLVSSFDDGATFEVWMTGSSKNWKPCLDGVIPADLFTHEFAPHPWPIDSMYLTPPSWSALSPRKFVALIGQPEDPQLALTFSDNLIEWSEPLKIELPKPYREINYRTMNPATQKIYFGSSEDGDTGTYEVVLEPVAAAQVKGKKRAAGKRTREAIV